MKQLTLFTFTILMTFSTAAMARTHHRRVAAPADAQDEYYNEQKEADRNSARAQVDGQDQWAMNQMAGMLQAAGRNPNNYNYSPDKYHSHPNQPTAYAISKDRSEKCEYYSANKCGGQGSGAGYSGVDCGSVSGHLSCYSHGQVTVGEPGALHEQYQGIIAAPAGSKVY